MNFSNRDSNWAWNFASALAFSLQPSDDVRCESGQNVDKMRTIHEKRRRSKPLNFRHCDSRRLRKAGADKRRAVSKKKMSLARWCEIKMR